MRYAARLARLWRRIALLPPKDPLAAMSDQEMDRASRVVMAEVERAKNWAPQGPAPSAEDVVWFEGAVRPHLARYVAFCDAVFRWEQRISPPRGRWARLACIPPAFAGKPRIRLPAGYLADILRRTVTPSLSEGSA